MPYSSETFDQKIEKILKKISPKEFFDIGAGAGKYGVMTKRIYPFINTTAIEIEKDYIAKFDLNKIYSEVWNISALDLMKEKFIDKSFDVVMMGDVIEHLKKSEGVDLLNFLVYRTRWIIIEFPYHYLQNSVDGYYSEAHMSVWDKSDFSLFESKFYKKKSQRLVIIKGYLENKISLDKV